MAGASIALMKHTFCAVAVLVLAVLFLVFLGLYLGQTNSEPVKQLQECQLQWQNHSSQTQVQITTLRKRVEDTQEAARKEAGLSRDKLEAMNKSLAETQENWHSCQNQLNTLRENITSWKAIEETQKEAIKNLQLQLAEKSKQLDDKQQEIQNERKRHQAEIQQLQAQVTRSPPQNNNSRGLGCPQPRPAHDRCC